MARVARSHDVEEGTEMEKHLEGKVEVVTGAGRGIGRAIALRPGGAGCARRGG